LTQAPNHSGAIVPAFLLLLLKPFTPYEREKVPRAMNDAQNIHSLGIGAVEDENSLKAGHSKNA